MPRRCDVTLPQPAFVANFPSERHTSIGKSSATIAPMDTIDFELRGEHIALDALLKATGLAPSGGSARQMIVAGEVRVDGQVELRKTAKMRAGQLVQWGDASIRVRAEPASA
jgi:ribosome-associated protein